MPNLFLELPNEVIEIPEECENTVEHAVEHLASAKASLEQGDLDQVAHDLCMGYVFLHNILQLRKEQKD